MRAQPPKAPLLQQDQGSVQLALRAPHLHLFR
jgi:hypothetical protein